MNEESDRDAPTIFPYRIARQKEVVLPMDFLIDECRLERADLVRIEVTLEGLRFTPVRAADRV